MKRFGQYSVWILAFLFAAGLIVVYKTIDNVSYVFAFFGEIMHILTPFLLGFIIAYILNIPCTYLQRVFSKSRIKWVANKRKALSVAIVYLVMIGVFVVAIRAVVPAIYRSILDIYVNFPSYIDSAVKFLDNLHLDEKLSFIQIDENMVIQKITDWFSAIDFSKFAQYAQGVLSLTSGVVSFFIALVAALYMLLDKERMKRACYRVTGAFLGSNTRDRLVNYTKKISDIFSKYLYSQLIDATIVMILATIILSLMRVKYAMLLGVIVGVCNLIPYFGAIFAVVGTILITCFTGGIAKGIWSGVALIVMQQIDANIIGPRIMGQSLELRPLWVIFAVTVGSGLCGVAGMILSVPVFAMLKLIAGDFLRAREKKLGIRINGGEDIE